MTALKFMEQQALDPKLMTCPYCGEAERLGVHVEAERRLIAMPVMGPLPKQKERRFLVYTTRSG